MLDLAMVVLLVLKLTMLELMCRVTWGCNVGQTAMLRLTMLELMCRVGVEADDVEADDVGADVQTAPCDLQGVNHRRE